MVTQTKTYSLGKIVHLNAELTRACNLRCDYCFNASGQRISGELDQFAWQRIIGASKTYGAESILLTGGEITVRKDAPDIIDYALASGLRTSILTNGFRLQDHSYTHLIPYLERVQISLDSATPSRHDARRGFNSWNIARKVIDYVRSSDVAIEISATVSEDSLDELSSIAEIASATGSHVLVRPLQSLGRASGMTKEDFGTALDERTRNLEEKFGPIFVKDFSHYVPVLGLHHDDVMVSRGYITVLPDGKVRGTRQSIFDLERAA